MRRRYVLMLGMAVVVVAMLAVLLARPGAPRAALGGAEATATPTLLPAATPTPTPPEPYFIAVAVVQHFGSTGDPAGDPLSSPPPAPAYHTAFDRRPPAMGTHYLALRSPDGAVTVSDIVAAVFQFGHTCL